MTLGLLFSFLLFSIGTAEAATLVPPGNRYEEQPEIPGASASRTQALKTTLDFVRERRAFGAPLFEKQTIRQRLAMLDAKVHAARAFMYECAWRVTQKHDVVQRVSMLKALTGELVNEVVQTCQQFHGGMGYMRETAIERLWRDARILAIGGGATEVMLDEVAKRY